MILFLLSMLVINWSSLRAGIRISRTAPSVFASISCIALDVFGDGYVAVSYCYFGPFFDAAWVDRGMPEGFCRGSIR